MKRKENEKDVIPSTGIRKKTKKNKKAKSDKMTKEKKKVGKEEKCRRGRVGNEKVDERGE